MFTGGSFQNFTLFALGVTPYITASIIVQLLTIAFPYFENLQKEGETGRKKMATITRYMTIVLAAIQATGMTIGLFRQAIIDKSTFTVIVIVTTLTAGTMILMWLGEQINEYGVGNGMSLLIFAGIAIRLPAQAKDLVTRAMDGTISWVAFILIIIGVIAVVAFIIYVQGGVRKIPVQYAKRVTGRKMYGGQNSHIPIKLNSSGVIPIIFSLSILQFPITIAYFAPSSKYADFVSKYLSPNGSVGVWVYMVLNILLIIGFTFFYTAIVFRPEDIADNLKNHGGTIPAIRPGKPTEEYLTTISKRLCMLDGVFLAAVASLPTAIGAFTSMNLAFGGTSLLILIGVATETVRQLNERELMNKYQGFLK
jgi:preprotein translocase subunit SecY